MSWKYPLKCVCQIIDTYHMIVKHEVLVLLEECYKGGNIGGSLWTCGEAGRWCNGGVMVV